MDIFVGVVTGWVLIGARATRETPRRGTDSLYDANGDLEQDGFHTYAWDANGKPVMVDSSTMTYDTLGRRVEVGSGSTYTQYYYPPNATDDGYFAGMPSVSPQMVDGYPGTNRMYQYGQARLISPDPEGLSAVDLTNRNTFNRYGYVGAIRRNAGPTTSCGLAPRSGLRYARN